MKMLCIFLMFTVLSFIPLEEAMAQILWQRAEYGMTVDQVREVMPQVVMLSGKQDSIRIGQLGSANEMLQLRNVKISNETFTAKFYFLLDKLQQVTLQIDSKKNYYAAKLVFDSVSSALTSKYGFPVSTKSQANILNMTETEWVSGRTNIIALVSSIGDEPDAILNINYQARLAQDADHL